MDLFTSPSGVPSDVPWQVILLSTLLAFVLSQVIAIVYERTYQGMSYSRSVFQTLALCSIVAATLMFTIGNNLARGLGIAGIFAIIRFRTNLRDPRDIVFIFASLAVGISCGISAYSLALTSTVVFCLASIYLRYVPIGTRRHFDGLLRLQMVPQSETAAAVEGLLKEACHSFSLVTLRETSQGERMEYAYQIKLKDPSHRDPLVNLLREQENVSGVNLMMQETTVEL